jgi:hypothetical protein
MEQFEIDGTTLLSWTIQVEAHDEKEARAQAESLAGWIDLPSRDATFHRSEHCIAAVRVSDPESE